MELSYRMAEKSDLDEVFALIQCGVRNMIKNGIYQWDDEYPAYEDIKADIEKQQLYVGIAGNRITVVFVINCEYDQEYNDADWTYTGESFRVIHRLCVHPDFQNLGIARKALLYTEELLVSQGIASIRLDTFTKNPFALKLYENLGYSIAGYADWRKGRFVLLEKCL